MLLRGKLVDIYLTIDEETRGNLQHLKTALMRQAGLLCDPLTAGQSFMTRHQGPSESVNDFATDLKRLFVESYPDEEITSAILLQRFLTGLLPAIARQLLLKDKPTSLERAVADAHDIEFALAFEPVQEEQQDVNVVHHKAPATSDAQQLQSILEQVTRRLEALETKLESSSKSTRRYNPQQLRPARQQFRLNGTDRVCWLCGEVGHIRRECPLNENGPARTVGGWPRR